MSEDEIETVETIECEGEECFTKEDVLNAIQDEIDKEKDALGELENEKSVLEKNPDKEEELISVVSRINREEARLDELTHLKLKFGGKTK